MTILSLILLGIVLYYIIKVGLRFYSIYRKVHEATKQFRDFSQQGMQHDNGSQRMRHTTSSGDIIEDRRTEDEINRKIFTKEEGEYVDFEEE